MIFYRLNVTQDSVECQVEDAILIHCMYVCVGLLIIIFTDLTLSFMNARLLDDVSFHPCIRYKRWEVHKCVHVFV